MVPNQSNRPLQGKYNPMLRSYFEIEVFGTNFTGAKRNETTFSIKKPVRKETRQNCTIKNLVRKETRRNEISFQNILKVFYRHSSVSSSSFKSSCNDSKWPLGVFDAARV